MAISLLGVRVTTALAGTTVTIAKPPLVNGCRVILIYYGVSSGTAPRAGGVAGSFLGTTSGSTTAVGVYKRTVATAGTEPTWTASGTGYFVAYAFTGAADVTGDVAAVTNGAPPDSAGITTGPVTLPDGAWLISAFMVTRGGLGNPVNNIGGTVDTVRSTGIAEVPLSHGSGFVQDTGPVSAGSYSRSAGCSFPTNRWQGHVLGIVPAAPVDPPVFTTTPSTPPMLARGRNW